MEMLIGLIVIYAWVHSVIIVSKKVENLVTYERAVLFVGLVGFVLYIMGTIE